MLSYLLHQGFMHHIVWYSENMEIFFLIQRLKLSKNMQFADIYMMNSDAI